MAGEPIQRIEKNERLSRVVIHQGVVYLSGLTADDRSQDTAGQTVQILEKADAFLATAGTGKSRLLSAQIWLNNIGDFSLMNKAWIGWVDKNNPPARATVEAKLALPDIKIEIQFTAAV